MILVKTEIKANGMPPSSHPQVTRILIVVFNSIHTQRLEIRSPHEGLFTHNAEEPNYGALL